MPSSFAPPTPLSYRFFLANISSDQNPPLMKFFSDLLCHFQITLVLVTYDLRAENKSVRGRSWFVLFVSYPSFTSIMQESIRVSPSMVTKLRATFLKVSMNNSECSCTLQVNQSICWIGLRLWSHKRVRTSF